MDKLSLCFLVIISLPGVFLQANLSKKAFVFPQDSANSYVTLSAQGQEEPLKAFTVCLRSHTALTRTYSLFSYATKAQTNEILLFRNSPGVYSVSVGGVDAYFNTPESKYEPMHFCASWESSSGIVELWVDGKPMARKSLRKGYTLGEEPSIILGQEQDSYAGGFDINQSFVGDIGDVSMWDFVLSPAEVRAVYNGHNLSPNVLNWQNMKYEAQGEVFVKTQLWT
ncbi:C-reactive protein [Suricata suricatta]|uniref:Pentraxin family member n=1 Tax=Suricata suricatta TaxID=37032 RepID=A0A673TNZ3_SURSU|nr:C-reactive protein [Suricata suricatta]